VRREPDKERQSRKYLSVFEVPYVVDSTPLAKYGYVWRGVFREEFDEHAIIGGELLVIEMRSREVLGFVRFFRATRPTPMGLGRLHQETTGMVCANRSQLGSFEQFLHQVLIPRE